MYRNSLEWDLRGIKSTGLPEFIMLVISSYTVLICDREQVSPEAGNKSAQTAADVRSWSRFIWAH